MSKIATFLLEIFLGLAVAGLAEHFLHLNEFFTFLVIVVFFVVAEFLKGIRK